MRKHGEQRMGFFLYRGFTREGIILNFWMKRLEHVGEKENFFSGKSLYFTGDQIALSSRLSKKLENNSRAQGA
ncbi:hypothetical protein Y1Q_0001194 [Alligator mississippiensis]|uniref:Uncharacterized protein n=1 Tax=Alligator mississippiensis TaxID=8496 RepID=A0A151PE38_ALLMI|nr:hypothetical protein Y1Q_0001194 [Alligator mississippiensis]